MTRCLIWVMLALPVGWCQGLGGAVAAEGAKPNIILVMTDDQGWGDVGYYDHPVLQTPHLDQMAREGLRLDRFYAAAPVCSPTRASVMSGRHPLRTACFHAGYPLRAEEIALPELLKQAGYVTGHFGKWHLGSVAAGAATSPGGQGFDEWISSTNYFDLDPVLSDRGRVAHFKGDSSDVTVDLAINFLRRHAADTAPMFVVVWFGSPHLPHQALEADRELYANEAPKLQHFYGELTAMDRAVGRLRQELETLGVRENTLLWFCSDNGGLPNAGRTGGRAHKGSIYEGGLRVSAVLEWPARLGPARVSELPGNSSDILPTLLEVAGVALPERPLDGVSLVPLFEGESLARPPMGFWRYEGTRVLMRRPLSTELAEGTLLEDELEPLPENVTPLPRTIDHLANHAAWNDWPWKLHRIADSNGTVSLELYNLAQDPMEERDLAVEHPDRVAAMRAALEAWQQSVLASMNGADY